jgi:hypothetical protein
MYLKIKILNAQIQVKLHLKTKRMFNDCFLPYPVVFARALHSKMNTRTRPQRKTY